MKLMIASDIHGCAPACKALLEVFEASGAQRLILLGDVLYHGPRNDLPEGYDPKAVISMLSEVSDKLLCVRGNCDTEVDQMVLTFPILADYAVLPLGNGALCYLTHGHRYNEEAPPPMMAKDILFHGHTHIAGKTRCADGQICLNPGSVSMPKGDTPPAYMILTDTAAEIKHLADGTLWQRIELA